MHMQSQSACLFCSRIEKVFIEADSKDHYHTVGCTKFAPDLSGSYNTLVCIGVQFIANMGVNVKIRAFYSFKDALF